MVKPPLLTCHFTQARRVSDLDYFTAQREIS